MEAPAGGVDDMTKLSYLHEPGVLQNLRIRYELNEIYVSFSSLHVIRTDNIHVSREFLAYFFFMVFCNIFLLMLYNIVDGRLIQEIY